MKRYLLLLLAGLLLFTATAPALAWEFSMKGEYEYRFRYYGRTGERDLFGVATTQNSGPFIALGGGVLPASNHVGFAGPNVWNTGATGTGISDTAQGSGVLITRGGFSHFESDAHFDDQRLTIYPEVKVNPAIRVHGVYTVGGLRHKWFQRASVPFGDGAGTPPFERYGMMLEAPGGAYNTAAIGSWEQLRATVQTPIAIFSIGMKDFPFGTGASLAQHTRANAFLTVVPYGPFRFLHGWWLSTPAVAPLTSHNSTPDSFTKPSFFQGALVTYNAANVEIGGGAIIRMLHQGAATPTAVAPVVPNTATAAWAAANASDNDFQQYLAYMKYFNGRFFFNAEYQWTNSNTHFLYNTGLAPTYAGQIGAAPVYSETFLGFAELGAICGPGKLSLMYGVASGQVANAPRNDVGTATKRYGNQNMNYQVLEPYNLLMFNTYGGGNQRFNADGTGEMEDAFTYAGRLDYAIASNLNFFGTFMWAHRWEKNGWFKGGVTNTGAFIAPTVNFQNLAGYGAVASPNAFMVGNFGTGFLSALNPYVDDGHIGWEANLGVDWKLLEGLTMNVRYAYWQPGKWFDQAYQAFIPNAGVAVNGVLQGRDAINAVTGSLMINF